MEHPTIWTSSRDGETKVNSVLLAASAPRGTALVKFRFSTLVSIIVGQCLR